MNIKCPKNECDPKAAKSDVEVREVIPVKKRWLCSDQAALYLGISVKSLRNLTSNGKIPHYKLASLNRYDVNELDNLILSQPRGERNGG